MDKDTGTGAIPKTPRDRTASEGGRSISSRFSRLSARFRRRAFSQNSSGESQPTRPVSGGSEKSPTNPSTPASESLKQPKKSSKIKRSPAWDNFVSPKSSTRPILSSQCSADAEFKGSDISPIRHSGLLTTTTFDIPQPSPTGDSRFDFGSLDEEKIIPSFFSSRTCYDAMPISGKVVVLSTDLQVKHAFSCLVKNDIRSVPLWESSSQSFVGMLTISDFINVLRNYYHNSRDVKDIENQKISTWRTRNTRPLIKISPNESLVNATKILIEERIHRLPVYEERRNSVMVVISRKRLLTYLFRNLITKFGKLNLKVPSFWKKSLGELQSQIGTWENIATVSASTKVIEALDIFCERQVSALPVVNEGGEVAEIFAKFDVFGLAKEQTYDNLDMTIMEAIALDKTEGHEHLRLCTLDEPLGTVIEKFMDKGVHRLVAVDEKKTVIGILSLSDIMKFLVLQPVDDTALAPDTIDETPEGAVGGQEDSNVLLRSGTESSGTLQKSSSSEKQDSSDMSEDLGKLKLGDTPEPLSEAPACEEDP